jgi:protein import protein ZIM17
MLVKTVVQRTRFLGGISPTVHKGYTRPLLQRAQSESFASPQRNYSSSYSKQERICDGQKAFVPSSLCRKPPSRPHFAGLGQHRYFTNKVDGEDAEEKASEENQVPTKEEGSKDLGLPGAQKGGKKLAIVYTCTVCDTRAAKQFTEQAYRHGVVIVTCPGCGNRHLIADNLEFFGNEDKGWNIEKGMLELGENVKVVNDDNVLELSIDDVYGPGAVEKATKNEASKKELGPDKNEDR